MVAFALLVMISIVAASVWITRRVLATYEQEAPSGARVAEPQRFVPLDDAPPGVLDAIVAQLRQRSDPV